MCEYYAMRVIFMTTELSNQSRHHAIKKNLVLWKDCWKGNYAFENWNSGTTWKFPNQISTKKHLQIFMKEINELIIVSFRITSSRISLQSLEGECWVSLFIQSVCCILYYVLLDMGGGLYLEIFRENNVKKRWIAWLLLERGFWNSSRSEN